jgi:hypothetical protein
VALAFRSERGPDEYKKATKQDNSLWGPDHFAGNDHGQPGMVSDCVGTFAPFLVVLIRRADSLTPCGKNQSFS